MPIFDQRQQNFIDALGNLINVFKNISDNNDDLRLIGDEKAEELSSLRKNCESMFEKLAHGKFTVAIVGLENSGKSTLGNTLIGIPDLLPTDKLRCTFTVTKILAGTNQNEGEVVFYTPDEFKQKFVESVEKISTLDPNTVDYEHITWDQIENTPKAGVDSFAAEDVKNMIDNRDNINNLLGKEPKHVSGDEQLRDPAFRQYITGQDPQDVKNRAISPKFNGYPYAVKEITIWSTNFKNMTDIVIYDVPGFNSTTALHQDQTGEMINYADAVILILDLFNNARITSEYRNIFKTKGDECGTDYKDFVDEYGTKYEDKVFVFGNKADLLVSSANVQPSLSLEARQRESALRKSVKDVNLSKDKYIVCGSAFLQDAEIKYSENITVNLGNVHQALITNGKLKTELAVLTELGLTENVTVTDSAGNKTVEIMGGVKLLINKLEEYYRTVRYDVLTERIGNILERARDFLKDINTEYETIKWNDGGIFYYDAAEKLDNFRREAGTVLKKKLEEIHRNRPFSKIFAKKNLEQIFPEQDSNSPVLNEILQDQPLNADGTFSIESVETEFRKRIFQLFSANVTAEIIKSKKDEIYKELTQIFLKNMGMSESITPEEKDELEKSVNELFNKLRQNRNLAENGLTNLRGDLFILLDVLIQCPFSKSRINKVFAPQANNFRRLSSLADYYADFNRNASDAVKKQRRTEFFTRILLQQSNTPHGTPNTPNVQTELQTFFVGIRNKGLLSEQAFNTLPLKKWATMLVAKGETFRANSKLQEDFDDCIKFTDGWKNLSDTKKIELLNGIFEEYLAACQNNTANVPTAENYRNSPILPEEITQDQMIKIFSNSGINITTADDMLNILNTDIRNLREFIAESLIDSLNMEGDFISLIVTDVDGIRFARNTTRGKDDVRNWVAKYTRKIRAADFDALENDRTKNERRNAIATDIKDALKRLTLYI